MAEERGRLRRIFGKVAAVIAVAATVAFYALGFQIGHAYYDQWQANKADVTISQTVQHEDFTKDLPWAEAGIAVAASYGMGAAAIAAGKKRDRYGYNGSYSSSYSSRDDGFFWGYMWGSSGRSSGGGGGGGGGSSKDNGGAALALVVVAGVALAAGASVVSYKAVKGNFFTGEPPLFEPKKPELIELADAQSKSPAIDTLPQAEKQTIDTAPSTVTPPVPTPLPVNDSAVQDDPVPTVDPKLVKRWKPLAV